MAYSNVEDIFKQIQSLRKNYNLITNCFIDYRIYYARNTSLYVQLPLSESSIFLFMKWVYINKENDRINAIYIYKIEGKRNMDINYIMMDQ